MMPDISPREERRKKRAPVIACILCVTFLVAALLDPAWQWLPVAVGTVAVTAVGVSIDLPAGLPRGGRRGSGLAGRGRDDDDRPVGAAAHQWHVLVKVSRLMPGPAGRRWLAEADSLLAEIAPARRGAAVRSYLLSAPRLAVMMWVREVLRRAQLGPRRPG